MQKNRELVLVSYDVSDPSDLRKVKREISAFAVGGQKSFYECWVTRCELDKLVQALSESINPARDKIHLFGLDESEFSAFLGEARRQSLTPFMVV